MILDEINKDMFSEYNCSVEGVKEFLEKNRREDYKDAQIAIVDFNANYCDIGELTVRIPYHLINDIQSEGIDCSEVVKMTIEELLRRKRLFNKVKDWVGKTVVVNNGDFFGEIKSIKYEKDTPWNYYITLKTGISDSVKLYSSIIDEIDETPVAINELGTFHTANQEGLISITGKLWWKKGHIDVYLEYEPFVRIEDQKTFELLFEFNKKKYEIDETIKKSIAKQLINNDSVLRLFDDYEEESPQKRTEFVFNQLLDRMDLWFINISANNNVYMDYNFNNGIGKYNVGVTINKDSYEYILNDVTVFSDIEDEYDEEDEEL